MNNKITTDQLIELYQSIGFNIFDTKDTGAGISRHYKYYTSDFDDRHYTLVLFRIYGSDRTDFRLYIHFNSNGGFSDSEFQISDDDEKRRQFILDKTNTIFNREIRDIKLEQLGICE
jgi:hypothetical protein